MKSGMYYYDVTTTPTIPTMVEIESVVNAANEGNTEYEGYASCLLSSTTFGAAPVSLLDFLK